MTTSFSVNVHDLEFILRQIKIAEAHAGEDGVGGISLRQAIQNEYGVSALDAALVPFGLRTVDGRFNNLLPSNVDYGASDTAFPRLTTPVYNFENDEDPFFGVTNTDYGQSGNVVDTDPRTISNLIVDQTAANPAAILAALKVNGIEGDAAITAQTAIIRRVSDHGPGHGRRREPGAPRRAGRAGPGERGLRRRAAGRHRRGRVVRLLRQRLQPRRRGAGRRGRDEHRDERPEEPPRHSGSQRRRD